MSTEHRGGNVLNELGLEEHDGTLNAKRVVSAATIYAVVNTSAAGQASVRIDGNVTLSDSKTFIGLTTTVIGSAPTIFAVVNTAAAGQASVVIDGAVAIKGNVTLSDSKTFIGLTTTVVSSLPTIFAVTGASSGNVTLDPGSRTGILGNVTLSDSKTFIGLTTTTLGASPSFVGIVTIANSNVRSIVGNVTVQQGTTPWVDSIVGNVTLSDAKTFIGLTTTTLGASPAFIGLTTTINAASTAFIGLVTALTLNAGTTKTLIPIPVTLSTSSQATIAIPTNNASIFVTSVILSSDATVRVSIKSGVSYLTGNASIGIVLNPGGGWVQAGAPDAFVYRSTPSASINIEKFDMTGTKANLGGTIMYYTE